jgi:hypothetical protein
MAKLSLSGSGKVVGASRSSSSPSSIAVVHPIAFIFAMTSSAGTSSSGSRPLTSYDDEGDVATATSDGSVAPQRPTVSHHRRRSFPRNGRPEPSGPLTEYRLMRSASSRRRGALLLYQSEQPSVTGPRPTSSSGPSSANSAASSPWGGEMISWGVVHCSLGGGVLVTTGQFLPQNYAAKMVLPPTSSATNSSTQKNPVNPFLPVTRLPHHLIIFAAAGSFTWPGASRCPSRSWPRPRARSPAGT